MFQDPQFDVRVQRRLKDLINSPVNIAHNQHRKAAVLVPLLFEKAEWHLLYIRRSNEVQDHKGQVAFPGGAIEPGDKDAVAAALRESQEEVGLLPDTIRVLGQMASRNTITGFHITPIIGVIPWPFIVHLQASEVSRVFTIPLSWLAVPGNHYQQDYLRPSGVYEPVHYFTEFDGELLWGITAAMTLEFIDLMQK